MNKPKRAILFATGILAVFDERGEQIPEYQGRSNEVLPRLLADYPDIFLIGLTRPADMSAQA